MTTTNAPLSADAPTTYALTVDGRPRTVAGPALRPLVEALREDLEVVGPKLACRIGVCGACAVLIDGELMTGCLVPVALAEGRSVTTVAGLTPADGLSPLQAAFVDHGAAQCGFCTPGQVVAATALLAADPSPTHADIAAWMAGNVCRCTGYQAIVEAIASTTADDG